MAARALGAEPSQTHSARLWAELEHSPEDLGLRCREQKLWTFGTAPSLVTRSKSRPQSPQPLWENQMNYPLHFFLVNVHSFINVYFMLVRLYNQGFEHEGKIIE